MAYINIPSSILFHCQRIQLRKNQYKHHQESTATSTAKEHPVGTLSILAFLTPVYNCFILLHQCNYINIRHHSQHQQTQILLIWVCDIESEKNRIHFSVGWDGEKLHDIFAADSPPQMQKYLLFGDKSHFFSDWILVLMYQWILAIGPAYSHWFKPVDHQD